MTPRVKTKVVKTKVAGTDSGENKGVKTKVAGTDSVGTDSVE